MVSRDYPHKVVVLGREIDARPIDYEGHEPGFELDYTDMYEPPCEPGSYSDPGMSFAFLKGLGDHFGTTAIDVDEISEGGCDTCDMGSVYGHRIQVYGPTKNVPGFLLP